MKTFKAFAPVLIATVALSLIGTYAFPSTTINGDRTITSNLTVSGHTIFEGVTSTGALGTGALVYGSELPTGTFRYCADAAGSSTTYTCTMTPTLTAYTTGMLVTFKPGTANTGGSTVNIDGLGAKSIVAANTTGSTLVADDLIANGIYTLEYDGTNFRKVNGPSTAWTGFAYSNSWADFGNGFTAGQYRKDNWGQVYIRGTLSEGTKTAGTTIITLPAGYRPAGTTIISGFNTVTTTWTGWRLTLATTGVITPDQTLGSTFMTLDGQNFSVY